MRFFHRLLVGLALPEGSECFAQFVHRLCLVGRSQVSIPERRFDIAVTEDLLNRHQVISIHDQITAGRVPEVVPSEILNARFFARLFESLIERRASYTLSPRPHNEILTVPML